MPSEETLREYEHRINKVIDYISHNLDKHLNLDELADVALFSKFHFHRIFSAMVGETINDFIRRLRLEKAATMLIFNPRTSLTDIALDCGFSSSANFTKAFKQYFNVPPSFVRNNYNYKDFDSLREILERNDGNPGKLFSNIGKEESNSGKDLSVVLGDNIGMKLKGARKIQIQTSTENYRRICMNVEVKDLADIRVAYFRHIGAYAHENISPVFTKLMNFAGAHELCNSETKVIGVSHDNPNITPPDRCRYDACITVDDDFQSDGEIGVQTLKGGKFAIYHTEIVNDDFQNPWHELMKDWLPASGYQPEDRPSLEIYTNNPEEHPEKRCFVDICFPVRPL